MSSGENMVAPAAGNGERFPAHTRFVYKGFPFANKAVHWNHGAWMNANAVAGSWVAAAASACSAAAIAPWMAL